MNSVLRDIRYALRGMRRTPLLACAMIVTLAVGIGLNSGAFALLDAFLFRPPTDNDPATFVTVLANYTGWYRTLFSRMPFKLNMFHFASYAIAAAMLFAVASQRCICPGVGPRELIPWLRCAMSDG